MKLYYKGKFYQFNSITADCNYLSLKVSETDFYTLVNEYDPFDKNTLQKTNFPMTFSYDIDKGIICKPVKKAYKNRTLINVDNINLQKITGFAFTICYEGNAVIKLNDEKLSSLKIKTRFESGKSAKIILLITDGVLSIKNIDDVEVCEAEKFSPDLKYELRFKI